MIIYKVASACVLSMFRLFVVSTDLFGNLSSMKTEYLLICSQNSESTLTLVRPAKSKNQI